MPVNRIQLHHHRIAQCGVRHAIAEHYPAIDIATLSAAGERHVH